MPRFQVFYSNQAKKFIKKSEPKLLERLKELFFVLMDNPVPRHDYDLLKIEGKEDWYRVRLSSHRVQYEVRYKTGEVHVMTIDRRDEHTYS